MGAKGKGPLFQVIVLCVAFVLTAQACIWDGDTLKDEIKKNPTLAEAILNPKPPEVDKVKLTAKLKELLAARKEDDPDWWNNVAGAYLRLGQAAEAAALLEPVVSRFEDNYGIHANLGTAYHLLGRYAEAEKHIARNLELNHEAHFGLEKYHLALLQYLAKPKDYQARHLYVDEFTAPLFNIPDINHSMPYALIYARDTNQPAAQLTAALQAITGNSRVDQEAKVRLLLKLAAWDDPPAYAHEPKPRYATPVPYDVKNRLSVEASHGKFELAEDEKFQEGVIYMATLNPDEPACMTMLGMAALKAGDLNLAQKAFEKATTMGSPLKDVLELKILEIQTHIQKSGTVSTKINLFILAVIAVPCLCLWALVVILRKLKRRLKLKRAASAMMLILFWQCASPVQACIWDSDSLLQEKWTSPKLAEAILKPQKPQADRKALEAKIAKLLANRQETKSEWWNDLAGAYIRTGQADKAVALLEPVVSRFENDYATHANLGTAYHLLGRNAEAEKHIARDLEINPEAHHGLEKYHLALLQYLKESKEYQSRHLFVDELSLKFFNTSIFFGSYYEEKKLRREEIEKEIEEFKKDVESDDPSNSLKILALKNLLDAPPAYKKKWNLSTDEKLVEGVIYMATLNPDEPACWTMLGVVALKKRDLNLAVAAFEKAVALDAPMKELLQIKIAAIHEHIKRAKEHQWPMRVLGLIFIGLLALLVFKLIQNLKRWLASRKQAAA